MSFDEGELRLALESFEHGDFGPFAALLDPAVRWDGSPQGHLWWRRQPT